MNDWQPFSSAPYAVEALFYRHPGYFCVATRSHGHYLEMSEDWSVAQQPTHWMKLLPPLSNPHE